MFEISQLAYKCLKLRTALAVIFSQCTQLFYKSADSFRCLFLSDAIPCDQCWLSCKTCAISAFMNSVNIWLQWIQEENRKPENDQRTCTVQPLTTDTHKVVDSLQTNSRILTFRPNTSISREIYDMLKQESHLSRSCTCPRLQRRTGAVWQLLPNNINLFGGHTNCLCSTEQAIPRMISFKFWYFCTVCMITFNFFCMGQPYVYLWVLFMCFKLVLPVIGHSYMRMIAISTFSIIHSHTGVYSAIIKFNVISVAW